MSRVYISTFYSIANKNHTDQRNLDLNIHQHDVKKYLKRTTDFNVAHVLPDIIMRVSDLYCSPPQGGNQDFAASLKDSQA